MAYPKVTIPQIPDDQTLEAIDAFVTQLNGWVLVYGIIDDDRLALRVGGYRVAGQKPILRDHDPERPEQDFRRTHFNSMTFEFEHFAEALEFHERFP